MLYNSMQCLDSVHSCEVVHMKQLLDGEAAHGLNIPVKFQEKTDVFNDNLCRNFVF